jgi:superfamily II DNA/RNA helicase
VKTLARELKRLNLKVAEMHSDLDQLQRDNVMLNFKAGKTNIIVATDILSRGIDIDDIEMVVNFDVPREAEDYVHRIGRTARADRDGRAITFVNPEDMFRLRKIERLLEKEVPKEDIPAEFGEIPDYSKTSESPVKKRNNSRRRNRNNTRNNNGNKGNKQDKKVEASQTEHSDAKPTNKKRRYRRFTHSKGNNAKSKTSDAAST